MKQMYFSAWNYLSVFIFHCCHYSLFLLKLSFLLNCNLLWPLERAVREKGDFCKLVLDLKMLNYISMPAPLSSSCSSLNQSTSPPAWPGWSCIYCSQFCTICSQASQRIIKSIFQISVLNFILVSQ